MADLVEVPFEDVCICCEKEEPPRGRNEILNEYGEKNHRIYSMVSNFFGASFDMQENFGCYICNICKLHLSNYFATKTKLEGLIESVQETSQELVPDSGANWSVSNVNLCIACSQRSIKKRFIVQSDAYLSTRKRKQSRPPPKPGEAYNSVSNFYGLSFRTHKSCGSFICLRCRYRLKRVEEELGYMYNVKQHILNNAQILKLLHDVFIAIYDFDTFEEDELPFQKGDHFHSLKEGESFENWMFALNLSTGLKGYIPRRFVTRHGGELNSEIWFQDLDFSHAEEMLATPLNRKGAFLVRRTNDRSSYVLSVLVTDPGELKPEVLHYKIQPMKNGFYRLPNVSESFSSIPKLIEFYQVRGNVLPYRLTVPCVTVKPCVPLKGFQIRRRAISVGLNRHSKEFLGDGSIGEVFFGLQRKTTKIAVKKLKRPADLKKFVKTTHAISKLNHHGLVQLLGVCTEQEPFLIITEYMTNGPLPNYLKENKTRLKLHFIIKTILQITDGMHFLETKSCVHRNLKAANILLGERNQVKVSDYGISGILLTTEEISSGKIKTFPELWTAPEALFENKYSSKSDVWSLGILLYELITFSADLPYADLRKTVMAELKLEDTGDDALTPACLERIKDGYRMDQPPNCPDEYYSCMCYCWNEDPEERPSFSYWYQYFENYDLPDFIEDEPAPSPSESADVESLVDPPYGKKVYLGDPGYGSLESNVPSTSRASSRHSQGKIEMGKTRLSSQNGSIIGGRSISKASKSKETGETSSETDVATDLDRVSSRGTRKGDETTLEKDEVVSEKEGVDAGEQLPSLDIPITDFKDGDEAETFMTELHQNIYELDKSKVMSSLDVAKSGSRLSKKEYGSRVNSVNSVVGKSSQNMSSLEVDEKSGSRLSKKESGSRENSVNSPIRKPSQSTLSDNHHSRVSTPLEPNMITDKVESSVKTEEEMRPSSQIEADSSKNERDKFEEETVHESGTQSKAEKLGSASVYEPLPDNKDEGNEEEVQENKEIENTPVGKKSETPSAKMNESKPNSLVHGEISKPNTGTPRGTKPNAVTPKGTKSKTGTPRGSKSRISDKTPKAKEQKTTKQVAEPQNKNSAINSAKEDDKESGTEILMENSNQIIPSEEKENAEVKEKNDMSPNKIDTPVLTESKESDENVVTRVTESKQGLSKDGNDREKEEIGDGNPNNEILTDNVGDGDSQNVTDQSNEYQVNTDESAKESETKDGPKDEDKELFAETKNHGKTSKMSKGSVPSRASSKVNTSKTKPGTRK